jgi:hypothetical protein
MLSGKLLKSPNKIVIGQVFSEKLAGVTSVIFPDFGFIEILLALRSLIFVPELSFNCDRSSTSCFKIFSSSQKFTASSRVIPVREDEMAAY